MGNELLELVVIYVTQELGNGQKTGHWKIKYNNTTVGELPSKQAALTRAMAQSGSLGVDIIKVIDENGEIEIIDL